MADRKVIDDWLIATQETIAALQNWVLLLDTWRAHGRPDPADFAAAVQQLHEAGLGNWTAEAGGHGLAALAQALELDTDEPNEAFDEPYNPIPNYFTADDFSAGRSAPGRWWNGSRRG